MPFADPLFGLLYESRSVRSFSQEDLAALLSEAQRRNESLAITGWLTYIPDADDQGGIFRQYLEGPERIIRRLFYGTAIPGFPAGPSIQSDPRHHQVRVIQEGAFGGGPPGTRLHPTWAMHWVEVPLDV